MKLKKDKILPKKLIKHFEIEHLKHQIEENKAFELLNTKEIDNLEFYPDLLVKYFNDIFLIHFIDEYIDKKELFLLSTLSLSFKGRYEKANKGYVIILFISRGNLNEEQIEVIKLTERIFTMQGEIDLRSIDELENIEDFPNYLKHKIWYQYYAYFLSYKEKVEEVDR